MPKLLYITTNLQGSGGVARVLSVKLNYLIERYGYTIHVVATNNTSETFFYEFNKRIVFHKIDIKNFGFRYLFKYKTLLQNIIDNVQPNIIINCDNGLKGSLLPHIIRTEASLVYEMHGGKDMVHDKWLYRLKFKLSNLITQSSIKKYKRFVVLTSSHLKEWTSGNLVTIPNPITISSLNQIENREKTILAVGRFSIEKGYKRLLHIWSKVSQSHPDWKLKVYGEGNRNVYNDLSKELKIYDTIELNDATRDIEKVYAESSIFLNTSFSEALPLTIIEAMHFGLPVVAYKTLGAEQLINNGENGYIVAQDNISEFIEKLKLLMNKEDKLESMSKKAFNSMKKYNLNVVMQQWHELFQSLSS